MLGLQQKHKIKLNMFKKSIEKMLKKHNSTMHMVIFNCVTNDDITNRSKASSEHDVSPRDR